MKPLMNSLASAVLLCGCANGGWTDFYGDARRANIPGDVRKFVINAQACRHFSGEEPYDAERAAFLKKKMDESCSGLDAKREGLLKRHEGNNAVWSMIIEAWPK